jgi:hypothetical protein
MDTGLAPIRNSVAALDSDPQKIMRIQIHASSECKNLKASISRQETQKTPLERVTLWSAVKKYFPIPIKNLRLNNSPSVHIPCMLYATYKLLQILPFPLQ